MNLLIGSNDERAESAAEYLRAMGARVSLSEPEAMKVLCSSVSGEFDAVLVNRRIGDLFLFCRSLKANPDPPEIVIDEEGNEPWDERLDGLVTGRHDISGDHEELYRKLDRYIDDSRNRRRDRRLGTRINDALADLCVSPGYLGHGYLREAVRTAVKLGHVRIGVTKDIYPHVAKSCGSTPTAVERSIRTAIKRSWELCTLPMKIEYFGVCATRKEWVPTNRAYICALADRLSQERTL